MLTFQGEPFVTDPEKKPSSLWRRFLKVIAVLFILFIGLLIILYRMTLPPDNFPTNTIVEIPEGASIAKAANILSNAHMIRSIPIFETFVIIISGDKGVRSGFYSFDRPFGVFDVALRTANGSYGLARAKVTFPEGATAKDMGNILLAGIPHFDAATFFTLAKPKEGFLFPDTYFFFPNVTPDEVLERVAENYEKKIGPLREDIIATKHSEREIIIMASIIEKETNGVDDYEMISGILWNRLSRHMRLQVDATFIYTRGVGRDEIRPEDIKADTSAYNTYTHDGLPPGAIANPGLRAIKAAINPAKTDYLFYLHEKDGTIHYAKTFDEHKKNIQKYLR